MTTEQLNKYYLPRWMDIARVMEWRTEGGRLIADLNVQLHSVQRWPDHAREAVTAIIHSAQAIAHKDSRAVKPEDLRQACNLLASNGGTASSRKFNQRHLNHWDRLRNILCDAWDMNATIAWLDPAEDDRKRTITYLKRLANEARLIAIARNAWHTDDWESLSQAQLDSLTAEIRKSAWKKF